MLPDFLCIGAQKAGTTWLHINASQHPQIWMPPIKEIHYFNFPSGLPVASQALSRNASGRRTRKHLGRLARSLIIPRSGRNLGWKMRYFLLPRNDEWYGSLFTRSEGQIAGDATASYACLSRLDVGRVHELLPEAKIIYLLRNPIDRDWSATAMRFSKLGYGNLDDVRDSDIRALLSGKWAHQHSDYLANLEIWEEFYGRERIFVGFFDRLSETPRTFLREVYEFLGVDSSEKHIPESVNDKRNSRSYPTIPQDVARILADRHQGLLEGLHERFDNIYTARWIDRAREILGEGVMQER